MQINVGRPALGRPQRSAVRIARQKYTELWTNIANSWCPLQNASGTPISRGASAAADWAAHCRLVLPRTLGRALASAGAGSGRALGEYLGEESHVLTTTEVPSHNHSVGGPIGGSSGANNLEAGARGADNYSESTGSTGGGGAHNTMQPTTFLNVMVKL